MITYGLKSPVLVSRIYRLRGPSLISATYGLKSPAFLFKIYALKSSGLISTTYGLKSPQPLNPSLGSPAHRFSKTNLDFPPRKSLKGTNLDSSAQRVLNIRSCTKLMQFWCNVQYSARVKWWTFDALSLTRKLHFPCGFTGLYLRWLGAFVKEHFVHHCPFKFDALLVYFASLSEVHHFFNYFWISFHNSLENSSQFFRFRFLSSLVQHYGFVTCKYLLTGFTYLQ